MTNDTTKDPRIIVAHLAGSILKKCVKLKPAVQLKLSRDKFTELASACDAAVLTLMYMYQEPKALAASDPIKHLEEAAKSLSQGYERLLTAKDDHSILKANIRWCLRTFTGLKRRFGNSGATLVAGIDLVTVQLRSIVKQGNFWKTRVTDGSEDYTVITNLAGIDNNSKLAVAFLPPREVGGIVSEAMFLGKEKRSENTGTFLDEEHVDAKEAAGILFEEAAKHPK